MHTHLIFLPLHYLTIFYGHILLHTFLVKMSALIQRQIVFTTTHGNPTPALPPFTTPTPHSRAGMRAHRVTKAHLTCLPCFLPSFKSVSSLIRPINKGISWMGMSKKERKRKKRCRVGIFFF